MSHYAKLTIISYELAEWRELIDASLYGLRRSAVMIWNYLVADVLPDIDILDRLTRSVMMQDAPYLAFAAGAPYGVSTTFFSTSLTAGNPKDSSQITPAQRIADVVVRGGGTGHERDFTRFMGPTIRVLRVGRSMTQKVLADEMSKRLGTMVRQSYISQIEEGRLRVSWERLAVILNIVECSPSQFFEIAELIESIDGPRTAESERLNRPALLAEIKQAIIERLEQHARN